MKLAKSIQTKQTIRLFNGKYKYKIVLLSKAASWFRGGDLNVIKKNLNSAATSGTSWVKKLTKDDYDYVFKLVVFLGSAKDYLIRVESPYINFYTNNPIDIEKLAKLNEHNIKYVSLPEPGSETLLDNNKVLVKNLDYAYKITMGKTRSNHSNFVTWCVGKEDRIRLTKSASKYLSKDTSWGGYYFYVKDDKTLTMVKMFLGEGINSVESVVKT
jgi:hypothetical protein